VPRTAAEVSAAVQLACLIEATAPKPGNVSPGRAFADTRYEDFLASAAAIGAPFADLTGQGVGVTIRRAVDATRRWTSTNTNLGIVLLLAPLACAAVGRRERGGVERPADGWADLRARTRQVLEATTLQDARDVYAAIRLAAPGGLGRAEDQDVASEPTMTLLQVMQLAAPRDAIAREYATGFSATFELGTPTLATALEEGLSWNAAVVEVFLTLLAASPDTHIARRAGASRAAEVSALAGRVLAAGGPRSAEGRQALDAMDAALRDAANAANPGATADLTAAAIFVVLAMGGWQTREGGRHGSAG
jgi:triphosphoribosyl-dephospho-CoA synthase